MDEEGRKISVLFTIDEGVTVEQAEAALEEMVTLAPDSSSVVTFEGVVPAPLGPLVVARALARSDWLATHDAQVRAEALAPIERISGHAIAAAIYSGGGAVHPDASDRVLTLLRAAMEANR